MGFKMSEALWVEKYRPRVLDEVINQDEIIRRLKYFVANRSLPHLLFAGPPGTGKTTAALALAHELYGKIWRENVLELNASVTPDTPIMVRVLGTVIMTNFHELDKMVFGDDEESEYAIPVGLEVLSFDPVSYKVCFKPISAVARHRATTVIKIRYEGGEVRATPDHSIMVLDEDGNIVSRRADDLKPGDFLLSFKTKLNVSNDHKLPGFYSAEVAVGSGNGVSKQMVLTLKYPGEYSLIETATAAAEPLRIGFVFNLPLEARVAFLKRFTGNVCGKWGEIAKFSSTSQKLLVELAWLARISGVESLVFHGETQLMRSNTIKQGKAGLLPAKPFIKFFEEVADHISVNWKYTLRRQLYEGEEMVSKELLTKIMDVINVEELDDDLIEKYYRLKGLASSDIYAVKVESIKLEKYDGWVYDVGVPGSEVFWGGTTPLLLHNSDERGIQTIRERVKDFARTMPLGEVPFKMIILDEADNMTSDAQQALRRIMEMFSRTTRFCLIANYPSKIIEPIQSRCAIFRFQPLRKEDVIKRLKYIASQENVKVTEDAFEAIWEISGGDMRRAINTLQAAAAMGGVVDEKAVYRVVGKVTPTEIQEMLKYALEGNFIKARETLRELMIEYGVSGVDIIKLIHRELLNPKSSLPIPEEARIELADLAGEINFRLIEGADEEIQLSAFLAKIALVGKKYLSGRV